MKHINHFFNELRLNAGAIWLDNETIKLSVPKKFQNQETKDFITINRSQIIAVLRINHIFSQEIFFKTIILINNDGNSYPLSPAQERLWFIEQYEQGTNAYHMPRLFVLDVTTDIEGMRYALQGIVWRHEVLRSTIEQREGFDHGIQVVHDTTLFIEDSLLGQEEDYESVIKSDINRPFNLSVEYPIRAKFYTVESESGGERRFLLINIHHIASDGWSMDIFQRELLSYYKGYIDGDKTFALPALDIQYKDYAVWQKAYLTKEVLDRQLEYWKSKLSGYESLEFPIDHIRPSQIDYKGSRQIFSLNKDLSEQLRLLAQRLGVTLHSVMLSSVNILLCKYTGQDDIVIGSPIANRHHSQTQNLIGFFVNMQVNRTILSKGQSYVSLIDQVHQDQIEAQSHQDLPFEKLVDELGVERDVSRHSIFQVTFVVQNVGSEKKMGDEQANYLKLFQFEAAHEVVQFDLSIFIDDSQEELIGIVNYATSLFDKNTIERFIGHYEHLLTELVKAPEQCYDQISLLLPSEYKEMVYDWNATDKDYPQDKTIYELFQAQAESTPDSVALVYEGQELSYRELNERSNQLARHIRCEYQKRTQEALRADSLIALCLDRGLEMVIGILAVLKSGGAYVPIDPEYPQERIDYILEDTGAVLVLSQKHVLEKEGLQLASDKVIAIDLGGAIYDGQDISNLPQHSGAKNLAYVIYTSGTTGRPKGVMIEHAGVVNLVYIQKDDLEINDQSKVLQYASTIFDASVWEIFSALSFGASLFILPAIVRQDVQLLGDYIEDNKINVATIPPALLSSMFYKEFINLKTLIVAGESASLEVMEKWSKGRRLINAYGPTESTVCATMHQYEIGDSNTNIGKPLFNMSTYVLDPNHQPVPVGVIGELHIGGAGLARGYLNRDDLTSERFITNAFATDTDLSKGYDRLYKTGDLVRWLADGNLEYIGRNDDQVKIRGYRIELGEIEHALSSIAGIGQSCVMVREKHIDTGIIKSLVGYYVLDKNYLLENNDDILNNWENLYDSTYEINIEEGQIKSDFLGWNSYVTGEQILISEMEQWRDGIINIIKKLNLGYVLEIGVGSGLLMYPLLNEVEKYVGLDISQTVINRHINYLSDKNFNTALYHLKADQIDQLPREDFYDTIIINSVCQYFPSIRYFEDILEKSINILSESGTIFLGDIRNYDLHKELIQEKLDYEGRIYTDQDVFRIAIKENELLISPNYFISLKNKYKNIEVKVLERTGDYVNELSKYRYDVIISFNSENDITNIVDLSNENLTHHCNIPYLNQLNKDTILEKLSAVLPEYMIPGALVGMESFPLTINGKLDKRSLPDPDFSVAAEDYQAPGTAMEVLVCGIWQEVLGLARVGVRDNFFRIGGDSILSIQVSSRIRQAGFGCQVKDIFECKSVEKLCKYLEEKNTEIMIDSEQGNLTGSFGLLPVQQWFIDQADSGKLAAPNHWNQSFLIKTDTLDLSKLKSIIGELVSYHDILRVGFIKEADGSFKRSQLYRSEIELPELKTLDISHYSQQEIHEYLTDWQRGFDLEHGPLFSVGYLYGYKDESARLYFALHHMLVDGVSWRILADDIRTLYSGKSLPQKGSSYRQWVDSVRNYSKDHPSELSYWEEQLAGMPKYESPDQDQQSYALFLELDKPLTQSLLHTASKAYHTEINDLLLTALAYALKGINQSDVQGITLEGHGRENIDPSIDHSHTVGWFTSMFPVRLEVKESIKESIQFIKESLRNIPNKGVGFGSFATDESVSCGHDDLPGISFNYLGQFDVREGEDNWQVVFEGSGASIDPSNRDHNQISINGSVNKNKLGFSVVSRLGEEKTKELAAGFKHHLEKVIEHCADRVSRSETSYTPSDFNSVRISQSLLDSLEYSARESQNELKYIYPATSLQQGFIYHALSQPDDDVYRVQQLDDYHEPLDVDKYLQAWNNCILEYPILRTAFNWEEDIIQIIYKTGNLEHSMVDISDLATQQERDAAIELIQTEDRKRGFDLSSPTLLRLCIIKQSEDCYTILRNTHHSIIDGWSGPILMTSLHGYYQLLIDNQKVNIKEDTAYLSAQEYIYRHKKDIQSYWDKSLTGIEGANDINALLNNPIDFSSYKQVEQASTNILEISGPLYGELKGFTQREGITINAVVQFVWHKLLQVYSGNKQSIVGTTISGRDLPIEDIENSVGLYINTLPLIIDWDNNNTILSQLHEIQQRVTQMNTHSFVDLAKLQINGERIFHNLFVFENYPAPKGSGKKTLKVNMRNFKDGVDYPLSIMAYEYGDRLVIKLGYDRKYLSEDKAQGHLVTLEYIIGQIIGNPNKLHNEISLLLPSEHQEMVYDWNTTDKDYPVDKTIYELFQAQAESTPDSVALVYDGQELSYRELNERSNQLARHIRCEYQKRTQEALRADSLIALCLDRGLEMIIGILAVVKSGGAYVPIDPEYPQERIDYILEDTGAVLVLSQKHLLDKEDLQLPKDKVITIDLSGSIYDGQDSSNLPQHSGAKNLAYVIYTSGTTGRPKGVMIEHAGVINTLDALYDIYDSRVIKKSTTYTAYVFDVFVSEVFASIVQGLELHILSKTIRMDSVLLSDYFVANKINLVYLPPIVLSSLPQRIYPDLQILIYAGEPCDKKTASLYSEKIRLFNFYGPTEACIYATSKEIVLDEVEQIGRAISNTRAYVLDQNRQPVPIGVIGELYIGGAGLARGYLNRDDLTSERFITNAFATDTDLSKGYDRLYKTGDLVRWLADGNLEYIGRNDDQVKIRGYRIELGEIEHALSSIAGIGQSCVMVRERETSGGIIKSLVGYYVAEESASDLDQGMILEQLSAVLPEYMIPGALVGMESFPLTINGKLDKRSLPDPDFSVAAEDYQAPGTAMEVLVCGIWQEVLGLARVGVRDNFFRIGGNSILAIQVSHRMSSALGCYIKIADIFKYKTILDLLVHNIESIETIIPKTVERESVLSFAQERLWFIDQYEQGTNAYHMPSVFELDNITDIEGIKYALEGIVSRHEILRSTIKQREDLDHGIQVVHDTALFIEEIRLGAEEDYEIVIKSDINRPFNLSVEYPIRAKFYTVESETGGERRFLLINIHHIASDGWSMNIFQRELLSYYKGYIDGNKAFALPALDIQYKDYATWQRNYLSGEVLANQLGYWKSKLSGYEPLEFPTDHIRPSQIDYRGSHQNFVLSREVSEQLRLLAQRLGVTLHSVMLSSVNILLGKYTGQDDIVIGSPIANRHHSQTQDLIGFFVNTQVNRTILSKGQSYVSLIDQVHQDQIEGQLHQDLPFEKLVDELGVDRDASRHSIFQVMFAVQSFGNQTQIKIQQERYFNSIYFDRSYEVEKFDLSIFIDDSQESLMGSVSYATSLFNKDTIERFIGHYEHLLAELVKAPEQCYDQISLLLPSEYKEMVYDWNATDKDYPVDKTIYELFQAQAESTPDSVALVYEGQELSYRELNERSNQLARHIRLEYEKRTQEALRGDSLIGLCLDRSLEMVIGILAVLKSGGAYVPIDPEYPQERVDYILEDTGAVLVLSQKHLLNKEDLQLPKDKVITIDLGGSIYDGQDSSNLPQHSGAKNLAYVIYTSGTTGRPKGVMIEHAGVINTLDALYDIYDSRVIKKSTTYTAYVFDVFVSEVFASIVQGLELHILSKTIRMDSVLLSDYFVANKINLVYLPPIVLSSLPQRIYPDLQILIYAGEPCDKKTASLYSEKIRLFNFYGPTEACIYATSKEIVLDEVEQIGRAISNTKAYVLDTNHQPVPVGVIGELYIGGAGLARGYLNRDDLTSERFITNAFATDTDLSKGYDRLYKTGDLVRWLADGNLEYIGRNDDQVKIRGYRIELGEIEHALSSIAGIGQSCVMVREKHIDTGIIKSLVGYYVLDKNYLLENNDDILNNWENLYDSTYEINIEEGQIKSDFLGWNSYVTGEQILISEMEQWRDGIINIIKKLNLGYVLEIGVGSGLLMYPLLNEVEKYVGLDISQTVINRHINYLSDKNFNTALYHLKADQIDQLPREDFYDTIIINSVCQYFPSIRYFEDILEKSINILSESGTIFLGDIRNYDLHKELIQEKLDYEGRIYTDQDVFRIAIKENELLISPNYFISLKNKYKNIEVKVLERTGDYVNELSKYRYDVIISFNSENDITNIVDLSNENLTHHCNIPYLNQLNKDTILEKLSAVLPEYMIPGALVGMESFPLTINGKLDKRSLPDPDFSVAAEDYQAPGTAMEVLVCGIWQEVLGLARVGVRDNFFRIGGDSILSIQVSSRIRQAGFGCQVKDIFECKSVEKLCKYLEEKNTEIMIDSEQGNLTGSFGLLPVQQWFIDQADSGKLAAPNHWNQSFLIKTDTLDLSKLKSIIGELVSYHDILRVGFIKEADGSFKRSQLYRSEIELPELKTLDISHYSQQEIHEYLTDWQRGFDLEHGPLFSVGYLYGYKDESARLYFALHHMLVDGVSWRILADDMRTLYSGKSLPQKGSSYRQWVDSVRNYSKDHPSELSYWEEQLAGMPKYESPDQDQQSYALFLELDKPLTQSLLHTASKAYHTEINDLLLTALAYALKGINQSDVQGITLEGHGRENIDPSIDHSHTVGWFTSMFPVRLEVKESIKESIQFIKESLRNIPNKGVGFGSFATDESVSCGHDDLPGISFNYLGQFDVREGEDNWQVVFEGSGASIDPSNRDHNQISINGSVNKNKLGFSVVSRLGEEKTKELAAGFKHHLEKVIEHCADRVSRSETSYTPSDFNSVRISQSLLDSLEYSARESQNELKYIYPATSLQQGFIYHALSQPDDDVYRVQQLDDYHEPLDVDKYLQAWNNCILEYPILRTAFNWEEDIIQIIYKTGNLEHSMVDISDLATQQERDAAIELIQTEDRKRGFDLSSPTLLRLCIIKQSEDCYTILRNTHHSIIDGWSGPILMTSLHGYYQLLIDNQKVNIKEDTAYLSAQEYIYRHKKDIQSYWDKSLTGIEGANDINALLNNPIDFSSYKQVEQASTNILEISGPLYGELKGFTQREGITINAVVQFVWHKLLQVYSGNKQSIVGTTISGRDLPIEDIENSVGLYINTLPLIIDWDNNNTILSQLHEIQQRVTQMNTHSFVDLAKLQINGERIFHNLFVFENYPAPKGSGKKTLKVNMRNFKDGVDYPLSIMAYEYGDRLVIKLGYDRKYLSEDKAQGHLVTLEYIIGQIIGNPNKLHNEISLLLPSEHQEMVYDWNATDKDYPVDKTIYELFQAQAESTPDSVALVYDGQELSYRELNERSNQLARHIRCEYQKRTQEALRADSLIALCLDRGLEMIIGILAVVKSGGAYVPIDPEYPQERIDYILEDTGAVLVLSQKHLLNKEDLQLPKDKVITIDLGGSIYDGQDISNLPQHSGAKNLAYVIYTSGTTGRPKGVMIEHAGVVNLVQQQINYFDIKNNYRCIQFSSYVFDAAVSEIFTVITIGAKLSIVSNLIRQDVQLLGDYIEDNKINVATIPPALLSSMFYKEFLNLKTLIVAGESASLEMMEKWSRGRRLINAYGPTEGTVCATMHQYDIGDSNTTIGTAISNTKAYVLDTNHQPVPLGVVGELYIGGAGLARGYLNREDLTAERFIGNPFATSSDTSRGYDRLYKTGDLVRWLADGNLEYIGRNDDQVKIRSYRIELGEIERALSGVEGISQSCVLVKEKHTDVGIIKSLVGYYVLDSPDVVLDQVMILEELSKVLPEYMIPGALVGMESFPLTINGKLDKRSLPDPDFSVAAEDYQAPGTAMEVLVCGIWQEVLGLARVGVRDNFFRIGGDSILSIQVSSRIRQAGFGCQVKDIFECKSVEKLCKYLEEKNTEIMIDSEQGNLTGSFELLPVQQWFIDQADSGKLAAPNHWNQSFLIKTDTLDLSKLKSIIGELVNYHDILRVGFIKEADGSFKRSQLYRSEIELPELKTLDISHYSQQEIHEYLTDWQSGFDLEHGPLFSVGYLYGYEDGSARIYFALHHMLVDGVSWRILADDMRTLYSGKSLPQKGSSYRQWVESVKNYSKDHPSELSYWEEQLAGMPKYESPDQDQQSYALFLELDKPLTQSLLHTASKAYHTEINDLLLTALAYALKGINQSDVQGITLEGHGRENIDPSIDHSHTVGWFTSMFPVRLEVKESIKESIQFIKESLRNIPNKGVGFGSFATDESVSCGHDDLPGINFNYLGQFEIKEGDNWQVVSEGSGASVHSSNKDHNQISINGSVNKNKLGFSIVSRLGEERTQELAAGFKHHLEKVIEHCADRVSRSETSYTASDFKDFISYEIINEHVNEEPIFLFPPAKGGAESYYNNIVPKLKDKKLILFNNYYLFMINNGFNTKECTIEKLAEYYKTLVKQLQPDGKYTFLGWSLGGVVAFEVLMQLSNRNHMNNSLILIDSFFDVKKAKKYIPKKFIEKFEKDINYNYKPKYNFEKLDIILFKASDESQKYHQDKNIGNDYIEIFKGIEKYFLESEYNGLDSLFIENFEIIKNKLKVINLEGNHENILDANSKVISGYLLKKHDSSRFSEIF